MPAAVRGRLLPCRFLLALLVPLAQGAAGCAPASADAAPVAEAGEAFLADLRAGRWAAAHGRLHAGLQQRCGSSERLRARVEDSGEVPHAWTVDQSEVRRYTATLEGTLHRARGGTSRLWLALDRTGQAWTITAWSVNGRELCP